MTVTRRLELAMAKAVAESRLAYQFAPSSYTAGVITALRDVELIVGVLIAQFESNEEKVNGNQA